jgi:hypothetical protein
MHSTSRLHSGFIIASSDPVSIFIPDEEVHLQRKSRFLRQSVLLLTSFLRVWVPKARLARVQFVSTNISTPTLGRTLLWYPSSMRLFPYRAFIKLESKDWYVPTRIEDNATCEGGQLDRKRMVPKDDTGQAAASQHIAPRQRRLGPQISLPRSYWRCVACFKPLSQPIDPRQGSLFDGE